ncbi:hypothetical protein [Sporosarcina sp. FSL W7-1283]|uniref:hypothetical protein n=1 Tax=Sporosarcina sp. FSL W7-1283 TaxID=2921560 RepID=UPI0030FC0D0D
MGIALLVNERLVMAGMSLSKGLMSETTGRMSTEQVFMSGKARLMITKLGFTSGYCYLLIIGSRLTQSPSYFHKRTLPKLDRALIILFNFLSESNQLPLIQ